ncbi:hypothetical protein BKA93DRAFT_796103 [Sparassis latifolia]
MPLYDSPGGTPPSAPKHLHHHHHHHRHSPHRRSQSPIPRITTLLPSSHLAHQYTPSTRAADISRLLDPAYASSASSGSSSSASPSHATHHQTRAYVDHHGDLHDPDYRDFPVLHPSRNDRRRPSSGTARSRSTSRGRYSSYSITAAAARPNWECDWSTEFEADEEEAELEDAESQSHFSPFATPPRRRASGHASPSYAYTPYAATPAYSHYFAESAAPVPMSVSPAGSLEENASSPMRGSVLEDEIEEEGGKKRRRRSISLNRNTSKKMRRSAAAAEPPLEAGSEKSAPNPNSSRLALDGVDVEFVPTCTYTLRQQWAAVILRVRFGLFHAQQRFARRRARRRT